MPGDWPAQCLELKDGKECPDGYVEMTLKEYEDYRELHENEYTEWYQNVYSPEEKKRSKLIKLVGNLETLAETYKDLQAEGEVLSSEGLNIIAKYDKYKQRLEAMG